MEDYRLTHSFFMGQKYDRDRRLIFHKKLLKPIYVDKWKSLSQLKIKGFRSWKSPLLTLCETRGKAAATKSFAIEITKNGDSQVVDVSPHVLLTLDSDKIVDEVKRAFGSANLLDSDCIFSLVSENVYRLSVLAESVSLKFTESLCALFGFEENVAYNKFSDRELFYPKKSFRDLTSNHIGVSVNFGFNEMISRHEIIGILSCESSAPMKYFDFLVVDGPLFMNLKFEAIYEIEIRLVNLLDGQVLRSIFDTFDQELFVTMSFNKI